MLGLTEPTVKNFNKDKVYLDILLSNDNLFFEAYEFCRECILLHPTVHWTRERSFTIEI
jgi:hypothetical protein